MRQDTSGARLRRPSPAMVVATLALISSLAGGAYAALVGPNSVNSKSVVDGSLRGKDVKDRSIGVSDIGNNAVRSAQLQDGSIAGLDIAADAISAIQIVADAIGAAEIAADAVGALEIATDAVTATEIANNAVDSIEIKANAVGSAKLSNNSVERSELGDNAVGSAEIENGSVGAAELGAQPGGSLLLSAPLTLNQGVGDQTEILLATEIGLTGGVIRNGNALQIATAGCYVVTANLRWPDATGSEPVRFAIGVRGSGTDSFAPLAVESPGSVGDLAGGASLSAVACLPSGGQLNLTYTNLTTPGDVSIDAASLQAIRVGA